MKKIILIIGLVVALSGCDKTPDKATEVATQQTTISDHEVVRECASGTTIYKVLDTGKNAVWSDNHWDYLADGVTPEIYCSLS